MRRALATSLAVFFSVGIFAAGCGDDDDTGDDASSGAGGAATEAGNGGTSSGGAVVGGTAGLTGGAGAAAAGGAASAGEGGQSGAPSAHGLECRVLTALCAADNAARAAQECNEVGRAGDEDVCRASLQRCVPICTADEPAPAEGGAGGISAAGAGGGAAEPLVSPYCTALGELCHAVDEGEGTAHDCHEVGHVGEPRTCIERFSSCARFCLDALDAIDSSGGAGGASGRAEH